MAEPTECAHTDAQGQRWYRCLRCRADYHDPAPTDHSRAPLLATALRKLATWIDRR